MLKCTFGRQRKMNKIQRDKKRMKRIPALKWKYRTFLYIGLLLTAVLSMLNVKNNVFPVPLGTLIYVIAACSLTLTCFYLVSDVKTLRLKVQKITRPMIAKYHFANLLVSNYRYRTVTFATTGLMINMVFAVFNGVIGIKSQSAWYMTLSVYYVLLSVMRYLAVNYERRISKTEQSRKLKLLELTVYKNCSILFIFMTTALGGMVMLTLNSQGGKHYPGYTIYAFALYAFIKIPLAIAGRIKAGRMKSPLLMTIRSIGYADACVAVLSLQTAMLSSFGYGDLEDRVVRLMNAGTGAAMCLMVLGMGIYGIYWSLKQQKEIVDGGIIND